MSASRKRGPSRGPGRGNGPAKGPGRGPAKGPARGAKRPPGSTRKPAPKRAIRVTPIDGGETGDGKVRLNRYLAQSGLEWARMELLEKKDLDGDGKVGQIGSPDGSVRRPFGGGSLWVQAQAQGKELSLTAFGNYQEITQGVRSIEESP